MGTPTCTFKQLWEYVLRSIIDRLMYNTLDDVIDANLTDANVGARKIRSCRNNLFVLGADQFSDKS